MVKGSDDGKPVRISSLVFHLVSILTECILAFTHRIIVHCRPTTGAASDHPAAA